MHFAANTSRHIGMHTLCIVAAVTTALILSCADARSVELVVTRKEHSTGIQLWLTISAQRRFIEISWVNAPAHEGDKIFLTKQEPHSFEEIAGRMSFEGSGSEENSDIIELHSAPKNTTQPWMANSGQSEIVALIEVDAATQWYTTGVPFDYDILQQITKNTECYGFWASYVDHKGTILATTCLRAYPMWMDNMRTIVGGLRLRDLFLVGTHDSGSYRMNFDPLLSETIVTKYSLCQDTDIRSQLMHGVRYLDIRVGYYRNTPDRFYINHGITKQRPLLEVIDQVKQFVLETNEIVIFGMKEFPVGFGKTLGVHRLLVHYLKDLFADLIVHPSVTWSGSLTEIWARRQNVILAYDNSAVVKEFPQVLFNSVDQRWGNVQTWPKLERYLREVNNYDTSRLSSRPVADMAELTPKSWDVVLDKYGGLRKMADSVNWRVSQLYRDELGATANIVAVDFMLGTTLMDTSIRWNKRKVIY